MTDTELEDHVRRALAAAAHDIHPAGRRLLGQRNARRRWVPALVAAAVVIAVAVTGATILDHSRQHQEAIVAGIPTVSGAIGQLDGIRFPIPMGWTLRLVTHDAAASTICIAPKLAPSSGPCAAVQMRVAIAQDGGSVTPLPLNPLYMQPANQSLMIDSFAPVGGRPAVREHFTFDPPAQTGTVWITNDLALEVLVRGEILVPEAEQIVDGLDLSQWAHHFGPVLAEFGSATAAPQTTAPTGPTG